MRAATVRFVVAVGVLVLRPAISAAQDAPRAADRHPRPRTAPAPPPPHRRPRPRRDRVVRPSRLPSPERPSTSRAPTRRALRLRRRAGARRRLALLHARLLPRAAARRRRASARRAAPGRTPARSINGVPCAGPGQSTTNLHSPFLPDDQYLDWRYTRQWEQDWTEVFLNYGNSHVVGTVGFQAYNFTDAGFNDTDAQLGIAQGFVTVTPDVGLSTVRAQVEGRLVLGEVRPGRRVRRGPLRHVSLRPHPPDRRVARRRHRRRRLHGEGRARHRRQARAGRRRPGAHGGRAGIHAARPHSRGRRVQEDRRRESPLSRVVGAGRARHPDGRRTERSPSSAARCA